MPLNKFASWGAAPRAAAPVEGIATVVADSAVSQRGFTKVAHAIKLLGHAMRHGSGDEVETPSCTAVEIVASLNALRELLFKDCGSIDEFNNALQQIEIDTDVQDVIEVLDDMPELATQFTHLFDALDTEGDLDEQRRHRIAEMVAVEWHVLAEVDDPDDDAEHELA
jgi:hypothetical protein